MLLLRGATFQFQQFRRRKVFQYMLLLRGATRFRHCPRLGICFNTCSSCEEQLSPTLTLISFVGFNTCSSCEEQLNQLCHLADKNCFNTCSSCEEQLLPRSSSPEKFRFNTCSSCEEQLSDMSEVTRPAAFQYMLLLRGATGSVSPRHWSTIVSIHAPLARSNSMD